MESIKIQRAQERAENCWKTFQDRTLTKRNARENVLLDNNFNELLKILLTEENESIVKIAKVFFIKCIESKMVSAIAFLTLIHQMLPPSSSCKSKLLPQIDRVASLIKEIEQTTRITLSYQLASMDPRTIPFLVDKFLFYPVIENNSDLSSQFFNFLLGDPDLVLDSSMFDEVHYKVSRCRILIFIVSGVQIEGYAELLMNYLIWNSNRQCMMELENLAPLVDFFSNCTEQSITHKELFSIYVEVLCNSFLNFGYGILTLKRICTNCNLFITEIHAFKLGSLLLLHTNLDSDFINVIINLLAKFSGLNNFSKICCLHLLPKMKLFNNFFENMRLIFDDEKEKSNNSDKIQKIDEEEPVTPPFTEFGMVTHIGLVGDKFESNLYEEYVDLIKIFKNIENFVNIDYVELVKKGHFELLFSLLAFKWASDPSYDRIKIIKCFLKLLCNVENEDPKVKILRYSWVVDFFETNFNDTIYYASLPFISEFVTNTDNILFAFVQQKVSNFLAQKENLEAQLPAFLTLFTLFESSQSRQSRLNFLVSMCLSFLHNVTSCLIYQVDTRAEFIACKLLSKLCEVAVIDPRDVWTQYVQTKIMNDNLLFKNSHIRGAVFCFASSFRLIPDGSEGELNDSKIQVIQLLLQYLSQETDTFVLDQICESLSKFNIENLKYVVLIPADCDTVKSEINTVIIDDGKILSSSILFNPSLLYEVSRRYPNEELSPRFKQLWTKLIDYEVECMPRSKFLGNEEKITKITATAYTKAIIKPITSSGFCNGLIFEMFENVEILNLEDAVKFIKTRLIPLIPSVTSLLWYIRPHLARFLISFVERFLKKIDDQRIRKKLSDYEFLLSNLKTGTTPQSLSILLLVISAIMKVSFLNQNISEKLLKDGWIELITKKLSEVPDFKAVLNNEEFLASFAVSASIVSGCSTEIDNLLVNAIDSMIIKNSKLKDGFAVYGAIEAMTGLIPSRLYEILSAPKVFTAKQKLIALLSLLRNGINDFEIVFDKSKTGNEDIILISEIIASKLTGKVEYKYANGNFSDPLEFKGLAAYVKSLFEPNELLINSKPRAIDSGSVPATLKYDAIFGYLLGSGFNLLRLESNCNENIETTSIENSTKDSKCLALLQLYSSFNNLTRNSSKITGGNAFQLSLDRFEKLSWIRYIGNLETSERYEILTGCKILPRIIWPNINFKNFEFVLKHVLSIMPITKIPFVNQSLLVSFFENVLEFLNENLDKHESNLPEFKCFDSDFEKTLARISEVIFNNSDDKNSENILLKLYQKIIERVNVSKDLTLLNILIGESIKYSCNNLTKSITIALFKDLNPEKLAELYMNPKFNIIINNNEDSDINNARIFTELNSMLNEKSEEESLDFIAYKIKLLKGKSKIQAILDILDLLFIYRDDDKKKNLSLTGILLRIFNEIENFILENKEFLVDTAVIQKIRSRSKAIPMDIYQTLENLFIAAEFDKLSF